MGSVVGLSPCCPVWGGRAPLGPTPGSSVVFLPRSVDVVEQRDGEGHAQELRKEEEEGYGEAADADMRPASSYASGEVGFPMRKHTRTGAADGLQTRALQYLRRRGAPLARRRGRINSPKWVATPPNQSGRRRL